MQVVSVVDVYTSSGIYFEPETANGGFSHFTRLRRHFPKAFNY